MKLAELSKIITPDQDCKLVQVFERHVRDSGHGDFKNLGFVDWVERDVHPAFSDCIMAAVPNMILGIEPDGYTHS